MAEWTTLGGGGFDYVQTGAPSGAEAGETWLDTSVNPPEQKVNDGSSWVDTASSDRIQRNVADTKEHDLRFVREMSRLFFDRSMDELNFTDGTFDVFVDGSKVTLGSPAPETNYGSNGYLYVPFASYNGTSISTQDDFPRQVSWKPDGTKLYETAGKIYEYNVGTAWDLSTASYNGTSFNLQDSNPSGLAWKSDGTKFYEIGSGSAKIYEYDVTTPWDLPTASYNNTSISTEDASPRGLEWKSDGTKLYAIGAGSHKIHEYNVNTPWDLSTASYNGNSVSTPDTGPSGLAWKSDGTKLYVIGSGSAKIYEYDVTKPWDLSTVSYNGNSVSTPDTGPSGLIWKPNGTKLYQTSYDTNKIYEYSVSETYVSWTVNLGFTPSNAVISHTTEGKLSVDYTITDSAGNTVTISDADVGVEYDVSALADGDLTVEGQYIGDGKIRDFAVYFD
jgi:sugar lactone lactonase YvrE